MRRACTRSPPPPGFGLAFAAVVAGVVAGATRAATPRFYPDDPIWSDDDRAFDASKVGDIEDTNGYDFLVNTFGKPGERRDVRALNVNTVDEVPDSSWFTNRIGRRAMSVDEVVRGPDQRDGVSLEGWVVSGGKGSGVQPGFRMTDPAGQLYQIEVDPPSNPELASAVEMIGTAFYHAMGYSVVEVLSRRAQSRIARDRGDGDHARSAQRQAPARAPTRSWTSCSIGPPGSRTGNYRVLVSRFAPGRPVGNFRYYGTRPDDPNDVVAHEHRRELRAARVFGAWLNHDDSRGINSLDMVETTNGRAWVKHYMFDFGSILGSGTVYAQRPRAGNEYIFEQRPGWLTLATLGLYIRPWMTIRYPDAPDSVGKIEAEAFDPLTWRPEYPNPAFENMRPDDAFWAARIVAKFSDEMIRKVVEKARYSDPKATEYMTADLIKRRDKVVAAYINQVCPVVDATLGRTARLNFANAAVDAGAATAPSDYTVQWFAFDNAARRAAGRRRPVERPPHGRAGAAGAAEEPGTSSASGFRPRIPQQPQWSSPATFTFRRAAAAGIWSAPNVEPPASHLPGRTVRYCTDGRGPPCHADA